VPERSEALKSYTKLDINKHSRAFQSFRERSSAFRYKELLGIINIPHSKKGDSQEDQYHDRTMNRQLRKRNKALTLLQMIKFNVKI